MDLPLLSGMKSYYFAHDTRRLGCSGSARPLQPKKKPRMTFHVAQIHLVSSLLQISRAGDL
jgi:hypothetical protein